MLSKGLQTFFTHVPATLTGMFIFLSVFVTICCFVMWRRGATSYYAEMAKIPFMLEEQENQNGK